MKRDLELNKLPPLSYQIIQSFAARIDSDSMNYIPIVRMLHGRRERDCFREIHERSVRFPKLLIIQRFVEKSEWRSSLRQRKSFRDSENGSSISEID